MTNPKNKQDESDFFYFDDTRFIRLKNEEAEQQIQTNKKVNIIIILVSMILCSVTAYVLAVTMP